MKAAALKLEYLDKVSDQELRKCDVPRYQIFHQSLNAASLNLGKTEVRGQHPFEQQI